MGTWAGVRHPCVRNLHNGGGGAHLLSVRPGQRFGTSAPCVRTACAPHSRIYMQSDPAACAAAHALAVLAPSIASQSAPSALGALLLHADCAVSECSYCGPRCVVALWPAMLHLAHRGVCEAEAALQHVVQRDDGGSIRTSGACVEHGSGGERPLEGAIQAVSGWQQVSQSAHACCCGAHTRREAAQHDKCTTRAHAVQAVRVQSGGPTQPVLHAAAELNA